MKRHQAQCVLWLLPLALGFAGCSGSDGPGTPRPGDGGGTNASGGGAGRSSTGGSGGVAATGGAAGKGGAVSTGGAAGATVDASGGTQGDADSDAVSERVADAVAPSDGGSNAQGLVLPFDRGGGKFALEFGDTYFEITQAGARITSYRLAGHEVLLPKGAAPTDRYFGSTLWASPQSRFGSPPAALDSADYTVSVDATSITMTSSPATSPKLSFAKKFSADLAKGAIVIEYSVKNEGTTAASWAAWEVTRVPSGGLAFFPILGSPTGNLTSKATPGYLWYDNATKPAGNKFFADGTKGYIAHTDGTHLLVKAWTDIPKTEQAPGEAEVEIYYGGTYNELEVQGPYTSLAPDEKRSFTVRWYLRKQPVDAKREVGDPVLISSAEALIL